MRGRVHRTSGIALADLGIILVGVAVVSVAIATNFHRRAGQQTREVTIQRLARLQDALDRYAIDNGGMFPTTKQGLQALLTCPTLPPVPHNWQHAYLASESDIIDGWGYPFHYAHPGGGNPARPYDVWSFGRDGRQGGEGLDRDVDSWDRKTQLP
jgi:general secretion pathway protein G